MTITRKSLPKPRTVLDGVERTTPATPFPKIPVTDEERREFAKQWTERKLAQLFAISDYDREVAKLLCERVADKFGPDDELSVLITGRIRVDRQGKKRGVKAKWTPEDLRYLLLHYELGISLKNPREDVLDRLSRIMNCPTKVIEKRLTEARKLLNPQDLSREDLLELLV